METAAEALSGLLRQVAACRHCAGFFPHEPRPVVQLSPTSRLVIVGQAPGRKVHQSGLPWDDPSGDRLREWLALSREEFYDSALVGHLPMGFCYPGHGPHGDLPPRKECAPLWHARLLQQLNATPLILLVGGHAQSYYLPGKVSVTERVKAWRDHLPRYLPLPHPSPRNNIWLRRHPWFLKDVLPGLKLRVREALGRTV